MRSTWFVWRMFGVLVLLYLALSFVFVGVITKRERRQQTDAFKRNLDNIAAVAYGLLESSGQDDVSTGLLQTRIVMLGIKTGARLTVIDQSGRVLADSENDPEQLDNHKSRPEVMEALLTGYGSARRQSTATDSPVLYVCVADNRRQPTDRQTSFASDRVSLEPSDRDEDKNRSGIMVLAAMDTEEIDARIHSVQRFTWFFAIGLGVLAISVTWVVSSRTIQPLQQIAEASNQIARGDYLTKMRVDRRHPAWNLVASAFERMQRELYSRETALSENARRLATVLGSMSEGVLAVNDDNRILFSNRAAQSMLGLEQESIDGQGFIEVARYPEIQEAIETARKSDHPIRVEFETRGASRRVLTMRVSKVTVEGGQGLVVVLHDVTEIRQLETMRRDFVANVSHELKTPLASIKAYSETLKLGAIHDQARNIEFVEQIEFQADRLHQLIMDLIQLARIESGQTVFDITAVSVARVLDNSAAVFGPLASSREIELVLETDEALKVRADTEGLRAIVDNLVSNALRYTQPEGKVTVLCERRKDRGIIEVIDTGIGIAPEHQQRVFERFYRVDKARSSDLGGTGLGLAIVKHLTHAFEGTVTLSSKAGRGSTFTVSLPLA